MSKEVKVSLEETNAIACKKVEHALNMIEAAQTALEKACGELSPIVHADKQWDEVGNMIDRLKELHFTVRTSVPWSRIDLDSDAKAKLVKKD